MTDPRIPPSLRGYRSQDQPRHTGNVAVDPLGWCVIATTALLTWLIGPIVLALLGAAGFVKYWRAWRSGNKDSNCILGDIRLVLGYLAVLTVVGIVGAVLAFV